jgi:aspartyl-tRNA(Asn)/glutamyl-tRNA(Gln) amidotransferase subunit A
MIPLSDLTVSESSRLLQNREISSRELTIACLERLHSLDPVLHSFLTLIEDEAMFRANRADFMLSRQKAGSPDETTLLTGIPIAVKDVLSLSGVRCTCGSRILDDYVPQYTATSVQRLLDAGVVILGKTNTDEFAMGSSTENSAYGVTRNPWDTTRVPGGSSGGSAAAVAACLVPAALGTDTGGSVRQPASFCGVSGIKTTYGRVSRYGLVAYGSSLDSVGVLARSVADTALLFQTMAGYDPLDSTSSKRPVPDIHLNGSRDLKGVRIGVPAEYFIDGIQAEVEQCVRAAIGVLKDLGAEIREVSLPHTEYALPVYYLIAPAEASANLARYDGVRFGLNRDGGSVIEQFTRTRGEGFGAEVKRRIMLGTYALSAGYYDAYYGQAMKVRQLIRGDFEKVFEQVDMVAAPVAPTTAFKVGGHGDDPLSMYLEDVFTLPANLAGVPGLAFPVGFDRQQLPVGMQLMGRHFEEEKLFHAGHAYQEVTDWHKARPTFSTI